jgi:hypothetical protein
MSAFALPTVWPVSNCQPHPALGLMSGCADVDGVGPQIAEWVIATFLAFQHSSKLLMLGRMSLKPLPNLLSVPAYLDIQRQGTWKRLGEHMGVEDAVGRRV